MTAQQSTVLVLGCASTTAHGKDQMRRLAAQAAARQVQLIGADTAENLTARGLRPGHVPAYGGDSLAEIVELDVHSEEACRHWAMNAAQAIDAVVTFREMCVVPTAAIAEVRGLKGNPPDAVRRVRTKDLAREQLRTAGFPQPHTLVTGEAAEAVAFMRTHGPGPWVVKPRDGMGSVGVSMVAGADDLGTALRQLPDGRPFLVETLVSGPEFSAEGLFIDDQPRVLALTAKRTAGFVETGHRMPAVLSKEVEDAARRAVEAALKVVGLRCGMFHVEFWLTQEGVVLGELHARPGGDFLHAMLEHSSPGLELYGTVLSDLLGRAVPQPPSPTAAAGADFLILPPGRVGSIRGWDRLSADEVVIAAGLNVGPGECVTTVRGSSDRHGFVVVGGASPGDVDATMARLLADLRIDVFAE